MPAILRRFLNIYKPEVTPFLFCTALLFLIRAGDILFENYAEVAFLKRFGVKYLPTVYMINAISTFFIMGIIASLQKKVKDLILLVYVSLFCGLSVVLIRILSPESFKLIYPLFYILKAQYEVILGLIFWNLANDIFNTRQSKRLFPVITAGGTMGSILASFLTPVISKFLSFEALVWVYLFSMILSASVSFYMEKKIIIDPYSEYEGKKKQKEKKRFFKELGLLKELSKKYLVVKLLIILTLVPNMVIPILNYTFNFAADKQFATESGILSFFSYFKGIMNILSFITLLFVGRLYNRFGLPTAMMIHPINYFLSFLGLFWRMDAVVASYARISTTIIRNTINNPARAALMGILPREGRALLRAFLRGGIVRIGIMSGSGLIYAVGHLFGPSSVPMAGAVLSGTWILCALLLKLRYAEILSRSILEGSLELKVMEMEDLENIFRDAAGKERLLKAFLESKGEDRIWYGKILRQIGEPRLNPLIVKVFDQEKEEVKEKLLELLDLSSIKDRQTFLEGLAEKEGERVLRVVLRLAGGLPEPDRLRLGRFLYERSKDPLKRAFGIWLLYRTAPSYYKDLILTWLSSEDLRLKSAGLVAVQGSKDQEFLQHIKAILSGPNSNAIKALAIETLAALSPPELNQLLYPFLQQKDGELKKAALKAMSIHERESVLVAMRMLLDKDPDVRRIAYERLRDADYEDPATLLTGLKLPTRQAREFIFKVLEGVEIKDAQVYRYVMDNLKEAYQAVLDSDRISNLTKETPNTPFEVLTIHLREKKDHIVREVIRVLASQVRDQEFKRAWKGIYSPNPTTRGNALELLDTVVDRRVGKFLLPLLESTEPKQLTAIAKTKLKLNAEEDVVKLLQRFISKGDWITVALSLEFVQEDGHLQELREYLLRHYGSPHLCLRSLVMKALNRDMECEMDKGIELSEKILMLRSIEIFQDLTVQELGAIALASKEVEYPRDTIVFREGEKGDALYFVAKGKVAVIKAMGEEGSPEGIQLAEIGRGEYFGEMALIEDTVRSATIKTIDHSVFLVLEKHEFNELVMEYPSIPLQICKVLSARLRALQQKLTGQVCET